MISIKVVDEDQHLHHELDNEDFTQMEQRMAEIRNAYDGEHLKTNDEAGATA